MKSCHLFHFKFILIPALLFLCSNPAFSQSSSSCGLIVNAGPDKLVCDDSPVTTLEGTVAGSGLRGYEWSPSDGLSNPNVLRPTVTVTDRKCYVLTAKKKGTTNLVINGDFEAGATGFTTDYMVGTMSCYGAGFLDCEGTYGVLNNPQLGHTAFSPCGDHTSGSGNMMVLNGAPGFVNVWCQNVPVTPNRDYCISAWACSVHPASPAQLEFTINGAPLGSIGLSGSTCLWEQLTSDWNSGGSANARICILNRNTATGGNDFAIDDISVIEVCEQSDTVCVDIVEVDAFIQPPPKICCDNPIVQLNGSGSSFGPEFSYCWIASNGGRIVSGETTLMPLVDRAGTYTLIVKGPEGCTEEYEVEVEGSITPPNAYAEVRDSLDCDHPEVRIFGGAFPDDNIVYDWTGPGGFRSNEQAPWVNQPGIYTLTVTNDCGCVGMVSVTVYENDNILKVDIVGDTLTCMDPEGILVARPNRPNVDIQWSGPGGFTSNEDSVAVRDTGWYVVMVTNTEGCENLDSFRLTGDFLKPDLSVVNDTITCDEPLANLRLITNAEDFRWTFMDSTISTDSVLTTGIPGTYHIIAIGNNGCSDSISVDLAADTITALFDIIGNEIKCDSTSAMVCFDTLTSQNARYIWTDPSGNNYEQNCLNVREEGWVILESQSQNGCDHLDSFFVDKLDSRPSHDLLDTLIDCNIPTIDLWHGIDSSTTTWHLPNGTSVNADTITADEGGVYAFEVEAEGFECPLRDSVRVTEDFIKPTADLASDSLTCTVDSVRLTHQTTDIISNWTWTGPAGFSSGLASPWVSNPGTYTAVIEAPNGCRDSVQVLVPQSSNYPDIELYGDTIDCSNPQVEVYAITDRSDLSFEWQLPSGSTSQDSSFLTGSPGEYVLIVSSPDSCVVERTINIPIDTMSPLINISGRDTLDCINTEVELEVISSGSVAVNWNGPGGFSSVQSKISVTMGGLYTVEATAPNGCTSSLTRTILMDTLRPSVSILGDTITCHKESVALIAQGNFSGTPLWREPSGGSASTDTLWARTGGLYQLTVLGTNGCSSTTEYSVVVDTIRPTISAASDTINCYSPEVWVTVSSNADSILWMTPDGPLMQDSILTGTPGVYGVMLIGKNGCISSQDLVVPIDTAAPLLTTHDDSLTCLRDSVRLSTQLSLATTYWWISSAGDTLAIGQDPVVDVGGDYICVAINEINGCQTADVARVNDLRDLPQADIETDQPDCTTELGGVSVLDIEGGRAPYSVTFNGTPAGNNRTFRDLLPGQHVIRITDDLGCISRDTVDILPITIAMSDLISEITIKLGDSVRLILDVFPDPSIVDKIEWFPNISISCTDCLDPIVSPEGSRKYFVEVTDTNGCVQLLEVLVKVELPEIYVPNAFTPDRDGINDRFFPFSNIPDQVIIEKMQIYTRWGELVFSNADFKPNDLNFGWDGNFNDEPMNPGVYVYLIQARLGNGKNVTLSGDVTIIR